MFKRVFILSGIIALMLTVLTIWLWYLPQQREQPTAHPGQEEAVADTIEHNRTNGLIR